MPFEIRQLHFSGDEVMDALRLFEEQHREAPVGPGINISYREQPVVAAEVSCSDGVSRSYEGAQLAAALISYCNRVKIVLPRFASKTFEIRSGRLVLILELAETEDNKKALEPVSVFTDARS